MADRRFLILGSTLLLGLVGAVPPGAGQSVFPVRLDAPQPRNPATRQSVGDLQIESGTHYWKRFTLEVSPMSGEDIIDITASQDDTTVLLRLLVASRQSDSSAAGSLREVMGWAIYDSGTNTWANVLNHGSINNSGGGAIGIDLNASTDTLTAVVTTPANHDLLTVVIEAVANRPVTFFEHF
jgi:hypothetical protein